jgi:membrane-bound inhibitor of C-type lysozyme
MKRSKIFLKVLMGAVLLGAAPAYAQSFQTYHCADGTEFIVGFYPYDSRAYVQIDGRQITLPRRLTLSGTRYSGGDVTLKVSRAGATTIRHAKRREAVCALY